MPITLPRKRPSKDKNFFENHWEHLAFLSKKMVRQVEEKSKKDISSDEFGIVCWEFALARLTVLDPLIDRYDYFDEILGAAATPFIGSIAVLGLLGASMCQGALCLLDSANMQQHAGQAVGVLFLALLVAACSIAFFIKSALSLLTRPAMTCIDGFKQPKHDRFESEFTVDDVVSGVSSWFKSVGVS